MPKQQALPCGPPSPDILFYQLYTPTPPPARFHAYWILELSPFCSAQPCREFWPKDLCERFARNARSRFRLIRQNWGLMQNSLRKPSAEKVARIATFQD